MKNLKLYALRLSVFSVVASTQLLLSFMSAAADTNSPSADPALDAKKHEADLAEQELRLQTALKGIAVAKKDAESASNPDVLQAEQQKAKAQAEQSVAEAAKAAFMAGLPTPTTKPLEGKIEVDDKSGYFTEILAFESAGDGANEIAKKIVGNLGAATKIYLVKQPDYLKGAVQLKEIEQRLDTFDKFFDSLKNRYDIQAGVISSQEIAPLLALAAIPAVVGALADVAALFRVDRAIKGHTTSVSDDALIAQVTSAIKTASKTVEIYRPSLNTTPAPAILIKIQGVRAKADKATLQMMKIRDVIAVNGFKIDSDNAKTAALQKKLDKVNEDFAAEQKDAKEEIKRLKGLYETVSTG